MNNPFSLESKTILVTGASSGIGKATALLCADMGAKVVAVGRNEHRLEETVSSLTGEGHGKIVLDLNDEKAVEAVVSEMPLLDGIANCAGLANMNPFQFVSRQEMDAVFSTNFFSPIMLVNKLLKSKKMQKGSSVVFVSSIDGPKMVHAGNSVYSASKSALVGMARNMAVDLVGKKIRVNCVLPGTTDTEMIRTANVTEEMLQETAKSLPMKRFAKPEEIANAILFLLSEASSYMTGTEIVVDGGSSIV
jgi:NAD(P)-dependent dehydrogenase (short-subunit alcohol dehydrogenase family)